MRSPAASVTPDSDRAGPGRPTELSRTPMRTTDQPTPDPSAAPDDAFDAELTDADLDALAGAGDPGCQNGNNPSTRTTPRPWGRFDFFADMLKP